MKKLAVGLATVAVVISTFAGAASANNDGGGTYPDDKCDARPVLNDIETNGDEWNDEDEWIYEDDCVDNGGNGNYPPVPVYVWTPTPQIKYGDGLKAKASGLCYGVPAVFAVQDAADWTHRYFSPDVWVNEDGTAYYQFSASELSSFYGQITVYAKQFGKCTGLATTGVFVKKDAPPKQDPPKQDLSVSDAGNASAPAVSAKPAAVVPPAAVVVAADPPAVAAAAVVPSAVLSSGVTAPAAAASPSGTARPAAVAGDSLPVTGSESSQTLQIALVAFAAGLGLLVVSARRRTASARSH